MTCDFKTIIIFCAVCHVLTLTGNANATDVSTNALVEVVKAPKPLDTLASVMRPMTTLKPSPIVAPKLDKLIANYQQLVTMTKHLKTREKIDYRLAQLLTLRSENQQEIGTKLANNAAGYYDDAIEALKQWLTHYPESTLTSDVMYDLAKVYELQGQSDLSFDTITQLITRFPAAQHAHELHFRRGEYLFSNQRYEQASTAYQQILDDVENAPTTISPFYPIALYMAGWSQYKLDKPQQSLAHFSQVLDQNLPTKVSTNLVVEKLPLANKQLVTDAFKVMNLIFSNAQGAASLSNFYSQLGGRYFEYLHYHSMAQEFLTNKRFRDSAHTYDVFVTNYPAHYLSPQYAINKVAIYEQGRFPTLAKLEKEKYVAMYGIDGPYWLKWSDQRQQQFGSTLRDYLSEMATDQYRLAQNTQEEALKVTQFAKAADLLLQYQRTFNDNADLAFLYAESLYASQQWRLAINAYNQFAYGTSQTFERTSTARADAAYAAILAFDDLDPDNIMPKPVANKAGQFALSEHEQNAIRFTKTFSDDERAVVILFNVMNHRFAQARYEESIDIVERILQWTIPIDEAKIINAKLIKAHSIYNQSHYQFAISAYEDVLTLLDSKDKRLTVINNNLAASLFNYAEHLASSNQLQKAVNYYQKILVKTPNSPVRKLAHYNAAQYLYKLTQFNDAVTQLLAFKARYPDDALSKDIDVQLASIYEQQQDWDKAASQQLFIANGMKESAAQQQALFLTAAFYEKAQDEANALKIYRRHANTYQQPMSRYLEVMNKITEKYVAIDQARKYRFWLKKIIKVNDNAGKAASSRSTFLAAKSALVFAKDAKSEFDGIKLLLPLNRSLTAKRNSLAKTLTAYKKVADYRVASFTTQSTFETAQVYRQLASDLMTSQRPKSLDDLALEQYEILLEEQAFPFEDQAIALFENNAKLSWQGLFDTWIEKSFERLSQLLPGRYNKVEKIDENVDVIY